MTLKSTIRRSLAHFFPSFDPENYKRRLVGKPDAEIFSEIYRKKLWGGRLLLGSHSGSGSRNPTVIVPYVRAVRNFLIELERPSVLDLGCGDFYVGCQLVDYASAFIACDIVDFVIEQNRRRYPSMDFKVIDAAEDNLPKADIILIRQVFQHLSNAQILKIIPKLAAYRYAVITEHLPGYSEFAPNLDKLTGPDHRVNFGSGVILTEPPFNLKAESSKVLCEVREFGGVIRTTAYKSIHLR
jgi:SAM-dependent methyltransferase